MCSQAGVKGMPKSRMRRRCCVPRDAGVKGEKPFITQNGLDSGVHFSVPQAGVKDRNRSFVLPLFCVPRVCGG